MQTFDLTAALPEPGVTVLEASAGTGKTYAVAALAARFVAEGVASLDRLLVITFSRAATQELRDRVRATFVEAAEALRTRDPGPHPTLYRALVTVDGRPADDTECAERRQRLLDAIASYDAATIATTHEFCHAVLRSLGVAGNSDTAERLQDDISALAGEVIDDRYLASYADVPEAVVEYKDARRAATAALENPHAELRPLGEPAESPSESPSGALVEFARGVRTEVEVRKRRTGVFTFDDVLSRLATAVEPGDGDASFAAERMRARWDVVLVDEFQDTDPVQWQVLRGAFAEHARLVLIGDPKQAIYAFRGGDIPTYLRAVEGATMHTLGDNWRSDPAVVDALQVLTCGARLGDERITVHPVAARREQSSLSGGGERQSGGVRLRHVRRDGFRVNKSGGIGIGVLREHIAADLAGDIAATLASGVQYADPEGGARPLGAGDIAVLLHSVKEEAPRIQAELAARGIPSVVNAAESVMLSQGAREWERLLEAMEKPQLPGRVRAAALTSFFPTTPVQLDAGGDELTDSLAERVRSWLDLFRSRGVAAVLGAAQAAGMAARVLSQPGGERLLTDLQHVGQLLHQAAQRERLGLTGLLAWLREAVEEGNRNDSRRRRLDVDAEAVQFVTIHGSKGLEYPVVYLPQLFDRAVKDWPTIHAYHEGDQRCLDVADSPGAKRQARREEAEEELRLAYVAMTRAKAQVVMWWAPTYNGPHAALTRLLFGRQPGTPEVETRAGFGENDDEVDAVLRRWSEAGAFRLESTEIVDAHVEPPPPAPPLSARPFDRDIDTEWRRTSYSGLIRVEEQVVGGATSEPEQAGTDDEDELDSSGEGEPEAPVEGELADLVSPMNGLVAGATFGSLVHAVLEHADPEAADLRAELLARVEEERRWWSVPGTSAELAESLLPMQHSPLGPLADDRTLAGLPLRDRLRELDFEIPMAGGDLGTGAGRLLSAFADALEDHLSPGDPMRAYADRLRSPSLGGQSLRGYLSGSIDVVLRVGEPGRPRYVVVDYKTNSLGEPGRPLTALDYTPALVTEAMLHSHYPLQAMLYSVVLHRYLRWRQPGYQPEAHLGGVLYLYVRGMVGETTPVIDGHPCGVFSWQPPASLVVALSALLDGRQDEVAS
jgi:exodeoxyribonuclease V beta subunit